MMIAVAKDDLVSADKLKMLECAYGAKMELRGVFEALIVAASTVPLNHIHPYDILPLDVVHNLQRP